MARIEAQLRQTNSWFEADLADWKTVRSWPVEELRRAALALHARSGSSQLGKVLRKLGGLPFSWTRDDLAWTLQRAAEVPAETPEAAHLELPGGDRRAAGPALARRVGAGVAGAGRPCA